MLNILYSNIYWSKTIKLLLLYVVMILFIITIVLLINEFYKTDNYYLKKQNKTNRVIYKYKSEKTYLEVIKKEEVVEELEDVDEVLPKAFNEFYYVPKKHNRIVTYVKKEKQYLPVHNILKEHIEENVNKPHK